MNQFKRLCLGLISSGSKSKAILERSVRFALKLRESDSRVEMQSSENSVWLQVVVIRGLLISLSAFAKWWLESKRESTIGITRRQRETSTFMAISYNTIKEPIAYLYCRNYFRHKIKRIKQLVYVFKVQPSQNLFF